MKNFSDGIRFVYHPHTDFGVTVEFHTGDIDTIIEICMRNAKHILDKFYQARGLMVMKGLEGIRQSPESLVELSHLFGPEVENYHQTLTSKRFFHETVAEILILSNDPPCSHPPPPKAKTEQANSRQLPVQFPQQVNWHTDQSYRRPPPDTTLLLAVTLPPKDQGQTLFSDCTAAYAALSPKLQANIADLQGIHSPSWVGRSREAVENGEKPIDLLPHQLPQCHPLVRTHPVTGELSLYICEEKQMDFVDGPIAGLSPGLEGEGAGLLHELLVHTTQQKFVYIHEWNVGDLVIGDNRNLLHCATWYDADQFSRLMWRTTVMGNPGVEYQGEAKSWIPADGCDLMAGMEHA